MRSSRQQAKTAGSVRVVAAMLLATLTMLTFGGTIAEAALLKGRYIGDSVESDGASGGPFSAPAPATAPSPDTFGTSADQPPTRIQADGLDTEGQPPAVLVRDVPEPTTLMIIGASLTVLGIARMRRRRR